VLPNITNLPQKALQSVHIDPGPHIGSGKTTQEIEKTFHGERREETFRRATEEDPSPGWTEAIDVMCKEGSITDSNNALSIPAYRFSYQ